MWLNAMTTVSAISVCFPTALGSLWGSKQLSTQWLPFFRAVPRAGQDGFHKWKNIHLSQASSCFFSRKFCSGNGFTHIWRGQCCGNLAGGWGEGIGWPPGDRTSHHVSWILAHHMLSFLEYLCRSVMRGSSICWVFLRVWFYLREMSSRKSKTLRDVLNESIPHKKPTRLTDYQQILLLLLHLDNYRSLHYSWERSIFLYKSSVPIRKCHMRNMATHSNIHKSIWSIQEMQSKLKRTELIPVGKGLLANFLF